MSRYSRIDRRMRHDEIVRTLSRPQPNGLSMWEYLLANPHLTNVPGAFCAGEAMLAEALGWELKGFREAFAEVSGKGLVKADWGARLVFIPKAINHNPPQSPNVVTSWHDAWDELPECELKVKAFNVLEAFIKGMGKGFQDAFSKACRKPSLKVSPNQDQDQDQDQDGDPERVRARSKSEIHPPVASATTIERPNAIRGDEALAALCAGSDGAFALSASATQLVELGEVARTAHPHPLTLDDFTALGRAVAAGKAMTWMKSPSVGLLLRNGGEHLLAGIDEARGAVLAPRAPGPPRRRSDFIAQPAGKTFAEMTPEEREDARRQIRAKAGAS